MYEFLRALLIVWSTSMSHNPSAFYGGFYDADRDVLVTDWIRWKMAFNKVYYTYEEEAEKFMIFTENREKVMSQNEAYENGLDTYLTSYMNPFADLTAAEFEIKMSGAKPIEAKGTHVVPSAEDLPEYVDWRGMGMVTSVKNQKDCDCSTCFAAAGVLEGQHCRRYRGYLTSLSAQQILDCAPEQSCCVGGSLESAMEYLKNNKIMPAMVNDWQNEQRRCTPGLSANSSNIVQRIDNKFAFPTIRGYNILQAGNEKNLMNAVAMKGPIAVNFKFSSELQFYSHGVFYDLECGTKSPQDKYMDALIVGYGMDDIHGPYWLLKFSWGTDWGEAGYVRMTRMDNHCGVVDAPIYPYF